jgi:hypothetical protein
VRQFWNRIPDEERERAVEVALDHPITLVGQSQPSSAGMDQ